MMFQEYKKIIDVRKGMKMATCLTPWAIEKKYEEDLSYSTDNSNHLYQ